jgi:hypothetical protein
MTTKKYQERLDQHEATFERLWQKIVADTNAFQSTKKERTWELDNQIEIFTDRICLTGAWVRDRLNGKIATIHNKDYKISLTKKIRNALGYTY